MGTILSIDTMAQRYGMLPSELLERATTFDMWICNSAIRYQQVKQAEAEGDFSHYSEEHLMAIKNSI
ncbi:MAG: hypothetical protein RJA42_293 [Bacteroidota bacterium]